MLKLSEAIRLGSMLHPQTFNKLFEFKGENVVGTCALGAALKAGMKYNEIDGRVSVADVCFSAKAMTSMPCPHCNYINQRWSLEVMITHLNDQHRWTRERIADWVETVEINPIEIEKEAVAV